MKTTDFQDILSLIRNHRNEAGILIVTHERPDGDAIGSASGLWTLLTENGFPATILLPDDAPDAYKMFLPADAVLTAEKDFNRFALAVSVDSSTPQRTGLGKGKNTAMITIPFAALDHHPDHVEFAQCTYVDPAACSASEIIYELALAADWKISPAAATRLLLGVVTDTGGFRFDNTTPRAHRAAAALMEHGADQHLVMERAYFSKPFNMAQFEAELFCNWLRTALDGKFAWFMITPELLKKYNIDIRNTENLIEMIRSIEGVTVAALIKPCSMPGFFKVSLRSKDPAVSVGRIARLLNGGGHEMAAGGTLTAQTPEEAEEILLKHVEKEIASHEK